MPHRKIRIINGPNLNLLGTREPDIYGNQHFDQVFNTFQKEFPQLKLDYFQSNVEGELINSLHEAATEMDGVVLNAGAYTHTSVALGDAIKAIDIPVIEVHISNIFSREDFRHVSYLAPHCAGSIMGFGMDSYRLALKYFAELRK
jgi:3-dehydroquinate dehydratase-2